MTTSDTGHAGLGVGLFHVVYKSDSGAALGGVSFLLNLVVSTPTRHITGVLHATQPVNPPLDLHSNVSGSYVDGPEAIVPPPKIARLQGHPIFTWPPRAGIGPVLLPNADMTLYIEPEWQGGTANLAFIDGTGHWRQVTGVKFVKVG